MGRPSTMFSPAGPSGMQYFKIAVVLCGFFLLVHTLFSVHPVRRNGITTPQHTYGTSTPVPHPNNAKPPPKPAQQPAQKQTPKSIPNFIRHGSKNCVPAVDVDFIEDSISKKAMCERYSPFNGSDARIATVSAQFGDAKEPYQRALKSHMLHSLIHGSEVHVMCDSIVDDLWNKPAFLLNLLLEQMLEPPEKRLEWIFWADRDTIILDQCRPMSSFLPPPPARSSHLERRGQEEEQERVEEEGEQKEEQKSEKNDKTDEKKKEDENKIEKGEETKEEEEDVEEYDEGEEYDPIHLIIANDPNGLNNGAFFLRVNHWSIDLLTTILGFRYFRPDVDLPFTEQSAMEIILKEDGFKSHVEYVPQHWFNAFPKGEAREFNDRTSEDELDEFQVRRGDYLVHFAGDGGREDSINAWWKMLKKSGDVWKEKRVQRDISEEIKQFWEERGY